MSSNEEFDFDKPRFASGEKLVYKMKEQDISIGTVILAVFTIIFLICSGFQLSTAVIRNILFNISFNPNNISSIVTFVFSSVLFYPITVNAIICRTLTTIMITSKNFYIRVGTSGKMYIFDRDLIESIRFDKSEYRGTVSYFLKFFLKNGVIITPGILYLSEANALELKRHLKFKERYLFSYNLYKILKSRLSEQKDFLQELKNHGLFIDKEITIRTNILSQIICYTPILIGITVAIIAYIFSQ